MYISGMCQHRLCDEISSIKIYFMKKVFLFVLSCIVVTTIYSQDKVKIKEKNAEGESYTVSGGLLGAVNWSQFRIKDGVGDAYSFRGGWSAGGWLNLPVANAFSIEPQLLFSSYGYRSNSTTPLLLNNGPIKYISVPVAFILQAGKIVAILVGPQIDFMTKVEDNSISGAQEDDFSQTSLSGFAGLELFPHDRVTVF